MSLLDVTASTDIELPDMTLTTCLLICEATADPTHVAIIQENRCVCAKGITKVLPVIESRGRFLVYRKLSAILDA